MTDDAATTTQPADTPDVGERRRAIRAERERRAQRDGRDDAPPPPATPLVRPYARISSPTGGIPVRPAGEDPADAELVPDVEDAEVEGAEVEDVEDGDDVALGDPPADEPVEEFVDEPVDEPELEPVVDESVPDPDVDSVRESVREPVREPVGVPDVPVVPETLREASWPRPVERLRAASAALWPPGTNPLQPAAAMTPSDPEPPAREPSEPEPSGSRAPEPAAWSLFTPVVPAEPPVYDDLEPYPSLYEPRHVSQPLEPAEPSADLPDDAAEPSWGNGADEWDAFSVRVGDDDAWLRGLRDERATPPPTTRAEVVDDPPEPEALPLPEAEPVTEERAAGRFPGAAAEEPAPMPVVPDDLAVDLPAPEEPEPDDVPVRLDDRPPAPVHQPADGPPDGPPEGPPETPHRGFGRPSADRLSRALSDDASSSGPIGRPDDDDGAPVRGTLEPVLRRSTERAKVVPVIRPPVMPPPPPDGGPQMPIRPAPISWAEAMAGDVVPGKKRRRRRLARARHESAGATEEYRPRAGADRSLTLLVVGMLLVLALLVGVAVWAFWPRAT